MRAPAATILVIAEPSISQELLVPALRQLGHTPVLAASTEEVLAALHSRPIDLVLLDTMVPGGDVAQLLVAIKSDTSGKVVPVVIIAPVGEQVRLRQVLDQGADGYLFRPFDPVVLNVRINRCLEKCWVDEQVHLRCRTRG